MNLSDKEILEYNRNAWEGLVRQSNRWTVPVEASTINAAREGQWSIVLTPSKPVPMNWFPETGAKLLCLASGGGQQVPVLAAAGYDVTSFDLTPAQLETDRLTAEKFGLQITTVEGDMADLSVFEDGSFDFVFNPCSTAFVPDVVQVYKEVGRVLRRGGVFMTGFTKPVYYLFDLLKADKGEFTLKYSSPYSDITSLDESEKKWLADKGEPFVFGHSLTDHIQGQLKAGLVLTDLFEDGWGGNDPIDKYFPPFVATRAVKG
jgi:ubiquinone/menaquinone biosynthesis C-methylase UbiE